MSRDDDRAGGHVPELEAVAGLALGVDEQGQARPGLVERVFRDVADVDLFFRGQLAHEEIGPGPLVLLLLLGFGRVALEGQETGVVPREGQAADLLEFGLFARGQVDEDRRRLDPLLVLPQGLRLLGPGIGQEGGPLGVGREARPHAAAEARRLPDREAVLLRPGDLFQDDLALALERAQPVHEPAPVGGQLGRADGLPGQDVPERDRPWRGGRGRGRRGGGLVRGLVLDGRGLRDDRVGGAGEKDGDEDEGEGERAESGHGSVPCRSFRLFS